MKIIEKWGKGGLDRRRFKKLVQTKMLCNLRKPCFEKGKFKFTEEVLFNDGDIAY